MNSLKDTCTCGCAKESHYCDQHKHEWASCLNARCECPRYRNAFTNAEDQRRVLPDINYEENGR